MFDKVYRFWYDIDNQGGQCAKEIIKEDTKMRKGKIYCPANGWDCPYYKKGECGIEDPIKECDDFGYFWDEDDGYICEDEERTAFEN